MSLCECAPIVDAVPGGVVFVGDLFDPPGVVSRILPQQMIGQLIEGRNCRLASAQVLKKHLHNDQSGGVRVIMM